MATKTAKTRNSERRSGKAWGKNHASEIKALSPEAQARKAHKDAERLRKASLRANPGSNITMPKITWEWTEETMKGRHVNTRRFSMVGACLAQERRGGRPKVSVGS